MAKYDKKNEKRSSLYVDTKVQGVLTRRVVFHFLMFICVGGTVGLFLQFLSDPFKPLDHHFSSFWSQSGPYVIAMLCMVPVFVKDTVALTHRMAGPIVRLRNHLRDIAEGEEVGDLKFRSDDFFLDIPPMFNKMVAKLESDNQTNVGTLVEAAAQVIGSESEVPAESEASTESAETAATSEA